MDKSEFPDVEDQSTLGKRKRTEDNQDDEVQPSIHNASHMDLGEDEPSPYGQISGPETKKSRVDDANGTSQEERMSPNPDSPPVLLPPEILQHIFSFLDPLSLARLLPLSHLTQMLLDPRKPMTLSSPSGRLRVRDQNTIWSTSRRAFFSAFPRPMENMSEIEMWRLIRGPSCHFCERKPKGKAPLLANSPWNSGPGPEGVRPIWPFRVRACGPCLESRLVKDSELLLSTSSVLIPGLPFAVFTPSLNYVTSMTLRQSQPPPRLALTKYYFRPQVQALEVKMAEARSLGQAATEEWYKGLEASGQSQMSDAARFEQWEASAASQVHIDPGPARRLSASTSTSPSGTSPAYSMTSSAVHSNQFFLNSPYHFSSTSSPQYMGSQPASAFGSSTPAYVPFQSLSMTAGHQSPDYRPFGGAFSPMSMGAASATANPAGRSRPERNFQDIIRMKAERRAEIERRCLALDPPIRASTLTSMDAFNAAVQIPMPLNDNAWDVLKGRILAQRSDAEQKEAEFTVATAIPQGEAEPKTNKEEAQKPTEVSADQIWYQIERPVRDKIKDYANEYISSIWADGRAINKATSGKFAADVLQHVRRRFYEVIAEEDTSLASRQMTIPHDSPLHDARKLRLEDMKWIFEEVIRPHTERFGREIFLCSTCDAGAKRFSFDAVIQHYAAKHTSELSRGNAVVYWKADWPAEPPFHPSPDTVWHREPEQRVGLGSQYAGSQYAASQYAASPPYFPNPGPSWMSPAYVPPGQPNSLYNIQCDELVSTALHIWDATDEIRDLPDSVRLYVIIHHAAMRLSQRFTNEPPLSMFTDCITHKPALRALKDLHDLQCKSCLAFGDSSGTAPFPRDLPMYNAAELFEHFQRTHVELDSRTPQRNLARPLSMSGMDAPRMDWKFDMIELPHESIIRNLMYSPGINLQKLQTISSVLPHYFPVPLPTIEPVPFDTGQPSRPSSHTGWRRQDARSDEGRTYGVPAFHHRAPIRYGETRYDDPFDRHGPNFSYYDPHHVAEPRFESRTYVEVLPPREIVYVERPPDNIARVEYVPQSDRYGSSVTGYGGPERPAFVSRRRSQQRDVDAEYVSPVPRYSPVVDDSPRPRPSETGRLDSADVRMQDHADSPELTKDEPRPMSPHQTDAISATENFLNNFDMIGVNRSTGNTPRNSVQGAASPPRLPSSSRVGDRGRQSHVGTPSRNRPVEDSAVSQSSGSRRRSPPPPTASQHRSRNVSPVRPAEEFNGSPLRASLLPDTEMVDSSRRSLTPEHANPLPDHDHDNWNIRDTTYDGRARLEDPRRSMNAPYETYRGAQGSVDDRYRYSREPPSPEMQYRRYEEPMKRYIEILPNGQQRMIEEYPAPRYAPVEYMQPAPREDRFNDRRGYYIDMSSQREVRYVDHQYDRGGAGPPHRQRAPGNDERYSPTVARAYSRHESDEPRR